MAEKQTGTAESSDLMEKQSSNRRYMSIDIFKGIAMIMVIVVHYNQSFSHNIALFRFCQMGCQIFFVLSGFCAALSYSKKLCSYGSGKEAIKAYYLSRYKAIAPAYYFMIAAVYAIETILILVTDHAFSFGTNRSFWGILCNVLFLHGLVPSANNSVIPGGWYIGTSMLFYLATPLVFSIFTRFKSHRKAACVFTSCISVLLLLVICLILPQYRSDLLANNSFGYFSVLTQYPCYALGILLFFEIKNSRADIAKSLVTGVLLMIGSAVVFFNPFFSFSYVISVILAGLSAYFLTTGLLLLEDRKNLHKPVWISKVGQNSLYIYLTHTFFAWPFVSMIKKLITLTGFQGDSYIVFFVLMPIVVIASYFSGLALKRILDVLQNKMRIPQCKICKH